MQYSICKRDPFCDISICHWQSWFATPLLRNKWELLYQKRIMSLFCLSNLHPDKQPLPFDSGHLKLEQFVSISDSAGWPCLTIAHTCLLKVVFRGNKNVRASALHSPFTHSSIVMYFCRWLGTPMPLSSVVAFPLSVIFLVFHNVCHYSLFWGNQGFYFSDVV